MKLAGFLLLFFGFAITLATFFLLSSSSARGAFVLSGIAIEIIGIVLVFRAQLFEVPGGEH